VRFCLPCAKPIEGGKKCPCRDPPTKQQQQPTAEAAAPAAGHVDPTAQAAAKAAAAAAAAAAAQAATEQQRARTEAAAAEAGAARLRERSAFLGAITARASAAIIELDALYWKEEATFSDQSVGITLDVVSAPVAFAPVAAAAGKSAAAVAALFDPPPPVGDVAMTLATAPLVALVRC
jgi:hypothetical protein